MIVNRQLMQEHKINEATIQFIQNKARIFKGVNVFDRMITTGKGYINSAPHFYLNEMIEAQKDFTAKVRSSSVVRNEEVLKILEDMRDDIMSKKQSILDDLESGKLVNMFDDLKRYGTSMRSRISELKASGYNIESRVIDKSGALAYFMPEYFKKAV